MDCFEELATVLNSAGMELSNMKSENAELIKRLFLWSDLMKCSSKTNETVIHPYRNYLTILYKEKIKGEK
ncbi:MAG: hypothetical protein ACI4LT_10505 [Treponema sp.]